MEEIDVLKINGDDDDDDPILYTMERSACVNHVTLGYLGMDPSIIMLLFFGMM